MAKMSDRPRDCRDWQPWWRHVVIVDVEKNTCEAVVWEICRSRANRCWMIRSVTVHSQGHQEQRSPGASRCVPVEVGHQCYGLALAYDPQANQAATPDLFKTGIPFAVEPEPQVVLQDSWFDGRPHKIVWPPGVFALHMALRRACRTRRVRCNISVTKPPSGWIVRNIVPETPAELLFCTTGAACATRHPR